MTRVYRVWSTRCQGSSVATRPRNAATPRSRRRRQNGLRITCQAIARHLALLAEAGLVATEPGERRRVRYRLRSAPMQVAHQSLAALARDWDRTGPSRWVQDVAWSRG